LSNGYVSDSWGFGQGWSHYRNFIRESRPSDAKALWTESLAWLKKRKADERLFVYLATIDPHVIYNPPAEYLAMYDADSYAGIVKPTMTGLLLGKIKAGKAILNDRDKRRLEALYDGEITYNDVWFGKMQQDLAALGMLDDSVIVVVSDHGDEFYEHGSVGHGHTVFQELVSTPLLFGGRGLPGGRIVEVDVEALDVLPTLLDLAGLPASPAVQGESLLPLMDQDGPQAARPAFSTHAGTLRGMKIGRYKLISSGAEQTRLYDLETDPTEQRDVSAEQPIAARHARDVFGLHVAHEERWSKSRWGVASNLRPEFSADHGL
jgi:arylsulfatase A-like enzyme